MFKGYNMKKVAIVTRKLITGGIEKALISMLEEMSKDDYEITLFVMARGGEFEQFIPKEVVIKNLYGEEKSTKEKIIRSFRKLKIIHGIKIGIYTIKAIKAKPGFEQEKFLAKILPKQNQNFDIAIAYHVPASFPVIYVIEHLKARKKIAWIHSDVEVYKKDLENYIKYYKSFNKIYCVSKYGKEKFNKQYPYLSDKTEVFYNIINKSKIYNMSESKDSFNDNFDGIRILTVGRLSKEKGYDIVPDIVHRLKKKNYRIRWYFVGDGELREELERIIIDKGMQDEIKVLGNKNNPYPYFKECDIYVQPSRHEGYCITLAEAKLFNKPIVTTDFVGALEQIKNRKNGLIVKFNNKDIFNAICELINSESLRNRFTNNLKGDFNNKNNKSINKYLKEFIEGLE